MNIDVTKDEIVKKVKLSELRGSLKTGLTIEEIDVQLKTLRDEWERELPAFSSEKMKNRF